MPSETSAQTATPTPTTICDFELLVRQDTAGNQIRLSYQAGLHDFRPPVSDVHVSSVLRKAH